MIKQMMVKLLLQDQVNCHFEKLPKRIRINLQDTLLTVCFKEKENKKSTLQVQRGNTQILKDVYYS